MHPSIDRLLTRAARDVQMLSALTPVGSSTERVRLAAQLRAGQRPQPRWSYAPVSHDELRRALDAAERLAEAMQGEPLARMHLERIRELSVEAALCAAAGTPVVGHLAHKRFAPREPSFQRDAATLCAAWLAEPIEADPSERMASDDSDPRSLLSRMRGEVGRRKLPFAVVVQPQLAALAATGERVILVASGRATTEEDVTRTVLHEIDGHAMPRTRAERASLALLRIGTARGTDDQEGLALVLEERHGCLGRRRRRTLAARHVAVQQMLRGADFGDVAVGLHEQQGLDAMEAVLVAERAFRGGDGIAPGLGRDRVYLESFARIRAHLSERPHDEAVLSAGQVALDAVDVLAPFVPA